MADAVAPLIPRDGSLVLSDGAALTLTVLYTDGDLKIGNISQGNLVVQAFKDRGTPYSLRGTEIQEISVSFSCHAVMTVGASSPLEAVRKTGTWAAATSTTPSASGGFEVHTVQAVWTGERSNFGATADSTLTLKKVRFTGSFSEGTPGMFSFEGIAYIFAGTDFAIT